MTQKHPPTFILKKRDGRDFWGGAGGGQELRVLRGGQAGVLHLAWGGAGDVGGGGGKGDIYVYV